ncbi:MAG: AAA family ATPase [Planctomycetes bacterium]|nr:AAA family ATPase [Planctomycetota bacterium]
MTTLFVFSGLPGVGKTTLGRSLAREAGAVHLRIDSIEQGLRERCDLPLEDWGYALACRIAADNLRLGLSVVADSCNPIEVTRRAWEGVAEDCGVVCRNIEVICSDQGEHHRRVRSRVSDIAGLRLPTWSEVEGRAYDPWSRDRIVIDTAGRSADESLAILFEALALGGRTS